MTSRGGFYTTIPYHTHTPPWLYFYTAIPYHTHTPQWLYFSLYILDGLKALSFIHTTHDRANSSISAMRPPCYYLLEEIVILGVIYGSLVRMVCNPAAAGHPWPEPCMIFTSVQPRPGMPLTLSLTLTLVQPSSSSAWSMAFLSPPEWFAAFFLTSMGVGTAAACEQTITTLATDVPRM